MMVGLVACLCISTAATPVDLLHAQQPPPTALGETLVEAGPEARELARQVGTWDVVMTVRPTATTTPVVVSGIVAERTMVGVYLNEVMKPAPGSSVADFRRIDYLTYDRLQARWEYVALDTRAPVGLMFAKGYDSSNRGPEITVYFDSFANPGIGAVGGSVRARHVDKRETDDRRLKQQYWTVPGEKEWLAVQYAYTRRR